MPKRHSGNAARSIDRPADKPTFKDKVSTKTSTAVPAPWTAFILVAMLVGVALIYAPVLSYDFTDWDDGFYVRENKTLDALDRDQVAVQFTSATANNYHPITMLSYAAEIRMAGKEPGLMHFTNVFLHALNCLLVFVFLRTIQSDVRIALVATALFAFHPMRVESVAWISARKDLLMLFFGLLSMLAYMKWVRRRGWTWYLACFSAFLLACLSKAMAVAFVPSLFLIDMLQGRSMRDLRSWLTKLPFIALALAIGILAIKVQDKALDEVDLAFWKRATIAAQNLPTYMAQQFLPLWSSPYYAYPTMAEGVLPWHYFLLALVAVAVPVWLLFERPPVLYTFSLLFFFFNIALVLQLLPVGHAVRADRYTYVAGIGWALLAALLIRDLCRIFRPKAHSLMFGMAYAVLLGMVAQGQVPVWKNALSVWDRIILDNPTSSIMYLNRSVTLTTAGRTNEALADLDMAVRHARPNDPMPIFLRGRFHMHQGSFDKAIEDFDRMTRTDVVPEGYLQSLAYALYKRGRCPEVIDLANKGLADQGPSIDLLNLRAHCSLQLGDLVQATTDLDRSSSIRQDYGEIWVLLGLASLARGDTLNGCTQLRQSNHWALFEKDLEQQRDQLIARYCPAIP